MVLGIDLGTTYSVGAYIDSNGEPQVITNFEGSKTTPSVVYIESETSALVGQTAKDLASVYPKDVISFVKNSMGKTKPDGSPEQFETNYGIYSPEIISAHILNKIVMDATAFLELDEKITDVVVTIPAYFNDAQRKATEDAIAIASLKRVALINEPTAAALYYATKSQIDNANVLVYDLGGGTFDVTIVRIEGTNITVKSTGGLSRVGGSFFDKEITRRVADKIKEEHGVDITEPEYADVYQDVCGKAEKAKIALSQSQTAVITVRVNDFAQSVTFKRDDIDDIVRSLYGRTESVVRKALKDAELDETQIDKVLMVGGSSRIPFISEHIEEFFGKKPSRDVNPDEVVALGAAIYGKQLTNANEVKRTIVDVCSHGIGINAQDAKTGEPYNDILIKRNTALPASVERVYEFAEDVEDIYLNILEGDRKELQYNSEICATNVKLPGLLKKGERVYVKLEMDKHQILHIYIRLPGAGNVSSEVVFDRKSNLSDAQISEWKKSAETVAKNIEAKSGRRKGLLSGVFKKDTDTVNESDVHRAANPAPKKERDKSKDIPKVILNVMDGIIGMDEVKECLRDVKNRYDMSTKRTALGKVEYDDRCIAVMGKSGMGMSTASKVIAEALYRIGVSNKKEPVVVFYEDIVKSDEQSTITAIQDAFQKAIGGVLVIDDFHEFYSDNENSGGMYATNYLLKAYQKVNGQLTLIISGYDDRIKKIFNAKPRFERLFDTYTIELLGYSAKEYVTILHQYAEKNGYVIDSNADTILEAHFKRTCGLPTFEHFYSLEELFDAAKTDVANKASAKRHASDYDYTIIRAENFGILEKVKSLDDLKEELNSMTGLTSAKNQINEMIKIQEKTIKKAKEEGREMNTDLGSMHMVFTGNPGTGKTTVARLLGQIYRELGVLDKGQFIEVTRKDLVSDIYGRTKELVASMVEKAIGGILFIDEAYSLYQDDNDSYGQEAVDTLVPLIENHRNEMMVIMAGYSKEMHDFITKANPGLESRFNTYIDFEDYSIDELVEIFHYNLDKDNYLLEGKAESVVRDVLVEKMREPRFGNARGVRNIYEAIKRHQMSRLADLEDWGDNEQQIIREADVVCACGKETGDHETLDDMLEELYGMTGLNSVKTQVQSMVNNVRVNLVKKQKGLHVDYVGTMHMIFAGTAGTGKTTVARLIGKIYKELGLLSTGKTIECSRSDLVAGYVGQTAMKTRSVIEMAIGGVLFIDEAYTLSGKGDNDFGKEAIEELLKAIEDKRDSMVVILAGYDDDMREFLESNQGLASRFKNWIYFEDYTIDEMLEIFKYMITKESYRLDPGCEELIKKVLTEKSTQKNFGNARGVRNIKDDIVSHVNNRIAELIVTGYDPTADELVTITAADIY